MKGMAIAIDTIIYLIIAVTVLAVLLGFFFGVFGPAKTRTDLDQQRITQCYQYIQYDKNCDGTADVQSDQTKAETAASSLKGICNQLKLTATGTSGPRSVSNKCCMLCP